VYDVKLGDCKWLFSSCLRGADVNCISTYYAFVRWPTVAPRTGVSSNEIHAYAQKQVYFVYIF